MNHREEKPSNYERSYSRSDNVVYETLVEISALNEHVDFARKIAGKYPWKANVRRNFDSRLREIEEKQNDRCLNLSVIGEFSSGKSSFINALIGEELLVSSVLQGTTVVNTLIEYSEKYVIDVVSFDKGKSYTIYPRTLEELRRNLSAITTKNSDAMLTQMVKVGIPSELLRSGIRIIDTPGTNSLESWHEDVTRMALRSLSDVSVVLTDATRALPETLLDFMDENISDIYAQCAIVVTCIDLVPKKERDSVMAYIKKKMSSLPKGESALVVPYCAPAVIGEWKGETLIEKNQKDMAIMSAKSASEIYRHLGHHRRIAQIKKLISFTGDLYNSLDGNMTKQADELRNELNTLKRSKKAPLSEFIQSQKRILSEKMFHEMVDLRMKLCDDISRAQDKTTNRLKAIINEQNSLDNLKSLMTYTFADKCKAECKVMEDMSVTYGKHQAQIFEKCMSQFRKSFRNEFESLKIFQMEISSKDITLPTPLTIPSESLSSVKNMVKEQVSKEDWSFLGGAATGAVIGSMIAPGVGTVIGGIIGFFAGGAAAPDKEKVKADTIQKTSPVIRNFLSNLKNDILDKFDKNSITLNKEIEKQLNTYLNKYYNEVQARIEKQQALYESIERKLRIVESDLKNIELHRQRLKSLRSAMN